MLAKSNLSINESEFIKALFVEERNQVIDENILSKLTIEEVTESVEKWKKSSFLNNDDGFNLKLKELGYDIHSFGRAIQKVPISNLQPYINEVNNTINLALLTEGLKLSEGKKDYEGPLEMGLFIRPFLSYISKNLEKMLNKYLIDIPSNREKLKENLLLSIGEQLLNKAVRSIVLELHVAKLREELSGETSEERMQSFIYEKAYKSENLLKFYEEYAVLTRLLITRTEFFLKNVETAFSHFSTDWEELKNVFNLEGSPLVNIALGLGDTHQKGKTVGKFIFESNKIIIYKPKTLSISLVYNQFLKWIEERSEFPMLKPYTLLSYEDHGWEELVNYDPCSSIEEVRRYYTRFGVLVGLMHMIQGADFHLENVIAKGEYPFVIDLETLFHQYPKLDFPDTAEIKLKYKQSHSVIGTGLLPLMMFQNADGKGLDLSALNGKEQDLPFKVLRLSNEMTDDMKFTLQDEKFQGANNLPMLNDTVLNAEDYLDEILYGYQSICAFLMDNKEIILAKDGPLEKFKNETIRIVARGTQQYFNFINESAHPDYMRDALYLEQLYDRLWYYPYVDKRLIPHEIKDMLEGDVPFFTTKTNSRDLYASTGVVIENMFDSSGYDQVVQRIQNLTTEEIEYQKNWIRVSIKGSVKENVNIQPKKFEVNHQLPQNVEQIFIDEAMKIGDQLLKEAAYSDDRKTASWLSANINPNNQWFVSPAKQGMYDGLGGISLFLLYLGNQTGEKKYLDAAEAAMNSALNPVMESKGLVSAFSGTYSLLYPLVHFQKYMPNQKYIDKIESLKNRLKNSVKEDYVFDVLGGSAGIIHLLLNAYQISGDTEFLKIANLYGEHLLMHAHHLDEKHVAWKDPVNQKYLGGFSHGTSGIAWALLRLSDIIRGSEYKEIAYKALQYDRSLFDKKHGNWKDIREEEVNYCHQWCHGSSGIGLSRILMKNFDGNLHVDDEIHLALNNIKSYGFKNNDTLCHGNMGDTELFLQASFLYQDDNLIDQARYLGYQVIKHRELHGKYQCDSPIGINQPGLFLGISGIGLQLLRLSNPDAVPAVLTLENVK